MPRTTTTVGACGCCICACGCSAPTWLCMKIVATGCGSGLNTGSGFASWIGLTWNYKLQDVQPCRTRGTCTLSLLPFCYRYSAYPYPFEGPSGTIFGDYVLRSDSSVDDFLCRGYVTDHEDDLLIYTVTYSGNTYDYIHPDNNSYSNLASSAASVDCGAYTNPIPFTKWAESQGGPVCAEFTVGPCGGIAPKVMGGSPLFASVLKDAPPSLRASLAAHAIGQDLGVPAGTLVGHNGQPLKPVRRELPCIHLDDIVREYCTATDPDERKWRNVHECHCPCESHGHEKDGDRLVTRIRDCETCPHYRPRT